MGRNRARYDDPAVGIPRNGMTLQKKQVGCSRQKRGSHVEGGVGGFLVSFLSVVVYHGWKYAEVAGEGRICEGCKNGSWLLWDLKIS